MTVSLIEGAHLTATNKRHLTEMVRQGLGVASSKRIDYKIIKDEDGIYDVTVTTIDTDSRGRRFSRSFKSKARITVD